MLIDDFKNLTLADKKRVLAQLQSGTATSADSTSGDQRHPRLLRDERADDLPFPLTDLQGAYLVAKANPVRVDQAGCHVYLEFDVNALDPARLEKAWSTVVAVHPMLRAEVMSNGNQNIQRQRALPPFYCEDHSADTVAAQQCVDRVREELSHKLYRPGDWPLYEIRVTHAPANRSRVHVSMDSWIVDAKSAEQIYRQWYACYVQPALQLVSPALEFRDFVHSMEAFKTSAGYARCLAYWRDRLRDCPDGPALPYSAALHQAPAERCNRRRMACRLPASTLAALQEAFATRKLSTTSGMLMLFCEAVRSWSASRRFGLILTMQNRPPLHADLTRVVGPFTSTALFDADHLASETLGERAQRYGEQLLDALNHGYVSAIAALRSLGPNRPERSFPVVFTSLLGTGASDQEPSWTQSIEYSVAQTPGTALHCQLREIDGELEIAFDCVPSWFADGFVEQFQDSFHAALTQAALDPACWEQCSATAICAPSLPALTPVQTDQSASSTVPMSSLQLAYLAERIRRPSRASGYIFRSFAFEQLLPSRLQAAFDGLLADHPMLRGYPSARGSFECFDTVTTYTIPLTRLTQDDQPDLNAETTVMLREFASERQWPNLRLHMLVRLDGSACLLTLLDMAVFDGQSSWNFYDDLFNRYLGRGAVKEAPQWKPYLQARAARPGLEVHEHYWLDKFKRLAPGPVLLAATVKAVGAHATVRWTHTVCAGARLEQLAAQHRVSVESVFLSAFAAVLARDSVSFSLGVVDYGHRLSQPALLNGFGDATRFAWGEVSDPQSMPVLKLARIFAEQLERDRFHACADPFKGLRGAIAQTGQIVSRSVVLTNCLDAPMAQWPGIAEIDAASDTPGVDLDNLLHRSSQGLTICWTVRRDGCDLDALAQSFRAYCVALDELAASPEAWLRTVTAPVSQAALVNRERLAQLARWNATDRPYDRQVCLHTLIERQAKATPYAVAVLSDDEVLTYQELDSRANRLAHHLQQHGVVHGALVAVMLSRSHPLITTLLAILKCGAAFIPLNVDDPLQRLTRVLDQAKTGYVVSTREHYGRHTDLVRKVILLDADAAQIERQASQFQPQQVVQPEDRAYIIFTSGSTGTPKGVVVRHRPVINLIEWAAREFNFTPEDRVLFVNPLSFDLAIFDIFGLLSYGGSIRIVGDAERSNALAVAQFLSAEPITFWNSAPAYLQMILPFLEGGTGRAKVSVERLRLVFLSGDWIPLAMPDAMRAHAPQAQVISLGGATEATVWSNYFRVQKIDPNWRSIPYGRPIQNARYYVLDEHLAPLGVGETGDLFIGGECLSDGYINEPELTACSFIPDPLHETPGAIMYRTGDRARFFTDGNIEFLGRIDQQVKLRGYRIELGEVEAALEACGLMRAVVVVREDHGGRRLVGFAASVDASQTGEMRNEAMWQQLKSRLSAYMVPSQVFVLPALPITTNGKVDRKKLAQDEMASLLDGGAESALKSVAHVAGVSVTVFDHQQLATRLGAWLCDGVAEVFGTELVDVKLDDNLGSLGFNSLHYTMLAAKLANELSVALNPALFYRYVSVAEILDYLMQQHAECLATVLLPVASVAAPSVPVEAVPVHVAVAHTSAQVTASPAAQAFGTSIIPDGAIAIIGMAGVMPQASDLDAFWANLQQGNDCTSEIPQDRWDWRMVDGDPRGPGNVTNVHRAAFMKDVSSFDAAFFAISPREAELMDPRQRMLLESVWSCLENACQRPSALRGIPVGIYIGATGDEYAALSLQPGREIDRFTLSGVSRTILANRISYLFDWHGPSEVVDTACSSSLVAVHNAVRALLAGDCSLAIAGGINIMIDPVPHVCLNKIGMLAADGRCKTFDSRADGYARGEGVGLVLLKPLADALRDGDPIHGVIRGSAINHGGRATALSAPNPHAQVQVISRAIRVAGIDCGRLGYIEAHGTGTALGDPIEIEALKETFDTLRNADGQPPVASGTVALSSVKPNVGHLESAAGIAGLLKAVMSVKHGVLPATLHLEQINPNIELDGSPFYIVREAVCWSNQRDPHGVELPRVAGVSSFGFGGVNAHVVVEQYLPATASAGASSDADEDGASWLFPLSAQSEAQLVQMASSLADFITVAPAHTLRLGDVAYTLQTARDSMQERLLLCADSLPQLLAALRAYVQSGTVSAGGWRGSVKSAPMRVGKAALARDVGAASTQAAETIDVLAQRWAQQGDISWPLLPVGVVGKARRIVLPTYRFARTRYWLPTMPASAASMAAVPVVLPVANRADDEIELSASDAILSEHTIAGQGVLPAAAYLALLRDHSKATQAGAYGVVGFGDIVWMQPFVLTDGKRSLRMEFGAGRQGGTRCSFVGDSDGKRVEYCSVDLLAPSQPFVADVIDLRQLSPANASCLSQSECYALFQGSGIQLGALYRTVQQIWFSVDASLAMLRCDVRANDNAARSLLILDGALQAIALHNKLARPDSGPSVPFHIKRLQLVADCPSQAMVHLQLQALPSGTPARSPIYNARLFDGNGRQIGWIEACAGKALNQPVPVASRSAPSIIVPTLQAEVTHHYAPQWRRLAATSTATSASLRGLLVHGVLDGGTTQPTTAPSHWIVARRAPVYGVDGAAACSLDPCKESDWDRLLIAAGPAPDLIVLDYRQWNAAQDSSDPGREANDTLYQPFDEAFALARSAMRLRLRQPLTVIALTSTRGGSFSASAVQALGAYGRAISSESPKIRFCAVEVPDGSVVDLAQLADLLIGVHQGGVGRPVNYRYRPDSGEMAAETLEPISAAAPGAFGAALQNGSVVLVSGGAGGIGRLVASFLLSRGCRVALLGRAAPDAALQQMRGGGLADHPDCRYFQADVTVVAQVARALEQIRAEWGPLRAVFHAAGARTDSLLLSKDSANKRAALDAKVTGAVVLDYATRAEPLDYFVSFSSLASYLGPVGQTDYVYANAFLNGFTQSRNQMARERQRNGLSCAVGWPLWRDGGMRMDDKERDYIRQLHGMEELGTEAAMQCLFAILGGEHENVALAVGDKQKIDRALLGNPAT